MRNATIDIAGRSVVETRRMPWKGSVIVGKIWSKNSDRWPKAVKGIVLVNPVGAPVVVYSSNVTVPGDADPFATAIPASYPPMAWEFAVASTYTRKAVPRFDGTPACVWVACPL